MGGWRKQRNRAEAGAEFKKNQRICVALAQPLGVQLRKKIALKIVGDTQNTLNNMCSGIFL